jgi:1-acyl-sn-glycerol-3-phosphate acyltransferase
VSCVAEPSALQEHPVKDAPRRATRWSRLALWAIAALTALFYAWSINRAYWRVTVHGTAVPDRGAVILAPVHRSFIDFFVVLDATRRAIF